MGIPLLQRDFHSYEQEFKKTVLELRAQGERIDAAVFGHIETHAGFEVILISVRDRLLGKEWLGRKIDDKFVVDLRNSIIS